MLHFNSNGPTQYDLKNLRQVSIPKNNKEEEVPESEQKETTENPPIVPARNVMSSGDILKTLDKMNSINYTYVGNKQVISKESSPEVSTGNDEETNSNSTKSKFKLSELQNYGFSDSQIEQYFDFHETATFSWRHSSEGKETSGQYQIPDEHYTLKENLVINGVKITSVNELMAQIYEFDFSNVPNKDTPVSDLINSEELVTETPYAQDINRISVDVDSSACDKLFETLAAAKDQLKDYIKTQLAIQGLEYSEENTDAQLNKMITELIKNAVVEDYYNKLGEPLHYLTSSPHDYSSIDGILERLIYDINNILFDKSSTSPFSSENKHS